MKKYADFLLLLLLAAMLAAVNHYLGHRALILASVLSAIWFFIAFVLLSRPPGVPEFVSDEVGSDEQHVIRKDVIPRIPIQQRFRLSLSVACGSCLLLWLSLVLLAG